MASRLTGQAIELVEGSRLLRGGGTFIDAFTMPGQLHAAFVRSTHAHARIVRIDVTTAQAMPGVVAVLTAADLGLVASMKVTGPPGYRSAEFGPLAAEVARLVGDPIAIVVADGRASAADAAAVVDVDYEPLTPVVDATAALMADAPAVFDELGSNVVYRDEASWGDVEQAFAGADRVVTRRFVQQRQAHAPLEGRGGVATFDPIARRLDFVVANKRPHVLRLQLASLLGLRHGDVRVRCRDIGGAFGSKGQVTREEVALCAAAVVCGGSVKWVEDRTENLTTAGQAREDILELSAAVSADGLVRGLRANLLVDQGAYPAVPYPSSLFPTLVKMLLPNAYRIAAYEFTATVVTTNKASYIPYRGPWAVETWARERLLDEIGAELDLDPVEVRRRNLLTADDQPTRLTTGPSASGITARETLDRAVELLGPDDVRREQGEARLRGRLIGVGLATFIEMAPGPADFAPLVGFDLPGETAWARIEPTGEITVTTSQVPHGQNHDTTIAQVAADELGVGIEQIQVVWGDTATTPFTTLGTGGSRGSWMASGAVAGAAGSLRDQVRVIAAHLLEANPDDLLVADGGVSVAGSPDRSVTLADVARVAYFAPSGLPPEARAALEAVHDLAPPVDGGWVQATHACVVEIDPETGAVEILRYLVVEDCGEPINPAVVEGQIRGGVAQGLAGVLYERLVYDADGQPQSTNLATYLVPSAAEIPTIEVAHVHGEPQGDHDHRGVGEGGAIGAPPALANAIADAVRHLGVTIDELYLPPQRLWELLHQADG